MLAKVSNDFSPPIRKDSCRLSSCVNVCLHCVIANRHSALSCRRLPTRLMIASHSCAWQRLSQHSLLPCAARRKRLVSLNARKSCDSWLKTFWLARTSSPFVTAFRSLQVCPKTEDPTTQTVKITFCVSGVISPLLANIYLNKLDRIWAARCGQLGKLIRYADDFVAMCRTESAAREALRRIGLVMDRLGLTLHPAKTRLVDLRRGKESFVFLGCTIRKRRSIQRNPRWHFMQRWPSPKATKKLRARIREITSKRQSGKDVKQVIAELTPVLRGWGNYFRTGNADREFNRIDTYVVRKLRRWQRRRGGARRTTRSPFSHQHLFRLGPPSGGGTGGYPPQAPPRRSSGKRVRENGTHGLTGGHLAQGCP